MKPAPGVVYVEIEGEMVLLNPNAEQYHGLDNVGARFWELFVKHEDVEPVVAAMVEEYDVEEARLRSDIETLLAQLETAGLVVSAE